MRNEVKAAEIANLVTATADRRGMTLHMESYGEDGVFFPAQHIYIPKKDIFELHAFIQSLPEAWRE